MVTEVKDEQCPNAPSPILLTLFGMVTEIKDLQLLKAYPRIDVTAYPSTVDKISTSSSPPSYSVTSTSTFPSSLLNVRVYRISSFVISRVLLL